MFRLMCSVHLTFLHTHYATRGGMLLSTHMMREEMAAWTTRGMAPYPYLLQAEVGVPGGDAFALGVCQRVQHAVVRMHRGQTVLLQLVLHNLHQLLHALVVICPITHNLHTPAQAHNKSRSMLYRSKDISDVQ